jgi:fatty acid/phospholipid biosynthesis enzyme
MGGDRAPDEIIQGVLEAIAAGIPCVLVGPENLASLTALDISGIPHIIANEIIAMDEDGYWDWYKSEPSQMSYGWKSNDDDDEYETIAIN